MNDSAREDFIEQNDAAWASAIRELDAAILEGGPDLRSRVAYKMLMYTLGEHRRNWVCGIGTTKHGFGVRFLYGVLLDDPRGVLRAGSSTLMTVDFAAPDDVDAQLVTWVRR